MKCVLGIDLGTSGCKVILTDERMSILAKDTKEYPISQPHEGWSEQNPEDWYRAMCGAVASVIGKAGIIPSDVAALSISGQMVGLVAVDGQGVPVYPCILWNDQRSVEQAQAVTQALGLEQVIAETGNVIFPSFFAPKILWLKQNLPSVYGRISRVMFPKDYLVYRLTGLHAGEVADYSGSCFMNIPEATFSDTMLEAFGVARSMLPERLWESVDVVGTLSPQAATDTGLTSNTVVAAGGGDQSCQALGSGIVEPNLCSVTIGTSGVVLMQTQRYTCHPQGMVHAFRHSVPHQYYLMGVMLSAGGSYQWLRNVLKQIDGTVDYVRMNELARQAPIGSEGLLFLPYLTGERCPYDDPYARGAWIGLTTRHDVKHIVRSVMEGITFGLYDCLKMITDMGNTISRVYASGGATNSALWLQMLADVFGVTVCTTNATEGGALGAALLAATAIGLYPTIEQAAKEVIHVTDEYTPISENTQRYRLVYKNYRNAYASLQPLYLSMCGEVQPGAIQDDSHCLKPSASCLSMERLLSVCRYLGLEPQTVLGEKRDERQQWYNSFTWYWYPHTAQGLAGHAVLHAIPKTGVFEPWEEWYAQDGVLRHTVLTRQPNMNSKQSVRVDANDCDHPAEVRGALWYFYSVALSTNREDPV